MTTDTGTVVEVSTVTLGNELAADAAAGATTLTVYDAVDFSEEGGTLAIGAEVLDYLTIDDEADTIALAAPLAGAYTEGTRVTLYPAAVEKYAQVMVGDTDEAVQATVPHDLWDRIADGVRADGAGEVVSLDLVDDDFEVVDVLGMAPVVDGSYIEPETLPAPEIPPSDGNPPPAPAEAPDLQGSVNGIFASWPPTANADLVRYRVYVSTAPMGSTDPTVLAPFQVAEITGTLVLITQLADGTPLEYPTEADPDADPPVAAQPRPYYVRYLPVDDDGPAAAASPEASAEKRRTDGTDLRPNSVDTIHLAAGAITAQNLAAVIALVGKIASGVEGRRWEADAAGIRVYDLVTDAAGALVIDPATGKPKEQLIVEFPTDGRPALFAGKVTADFLDVLLGFTISGTANEISEAAALYLAAGVSDPVTPPEPEVTWESVAYSGPSLTNFTLAGLTQGHDARWYTAISRETSAGGTSLVMACDASGAWQQTYTLDGAYLPLGGVVYASHHGGRYYLLVQERSDGSWHIESRDTAMALLRRDVVEPFDDTHRPTLGWDFTNSRLIWAAAVLLSGERRIMSQSRTYNADGTFNDGGQLVITPAGYSYPRDLAYVTRVATEHGDRYVFRAAEWAGTVKNFQVFTTAQPGVQQTNEFWPAAHDTGIAGAWYDGTHFHSVDPSGRRSKYERDGNMFTTESDQWSVQHAWYDADAAGTGTHETKPSPAATVTMKKRARLQMVTRAPADRGGADDPNAVRFYLKRGTGTYRRQGESGDGTLTIANAIWTGTGLSPSATNTFPQGVAALLAAVAGGFWVDGKSNGSVGTGTFLDSILAAVRSAGMPRARWYKIGTQSVANTGSHTTQVGIGTQDADLADDFGQTTADSQSIGADSWTIPAGEYDITVNLTFAVSTTGRRSMLLTRNSTAQPTASDTFVVGGDNRAASPAGPTSLTVTLRRRWTSATTLRVWASQNSGASLNLVPDQGGCELTITRLGD